MKALAWHGKRVVRIGGVPVGHGVETFQKEQKGAIKVVIQP